MFHACPALHSCFKLVSRFYGLLSMISVYRISIISIILSVTALCPYNITGPRFTTSEVICLFKRFTIPEVICLIPD